MATNLPPVFRLFDFVRLVIAGIVNPRTKMIIAMTTRSSMSVNAPRAFTRLSVIGDRGSVDRDRRRSTKRIIKEELERRRRKT